MQLSKCINAHLDEFDSRSFVTSPYISSNSLFVFRLLAGLYIIGLGIIVMLVPDPNHTTPPKYFFYLTNLRYVFDNSICNVVFFSWWGLGLYFLSSAFHTLLHIMSKSKHLKIKYSITKILIWNSYILPVTLHFIVVVVFWTILFPMYLTGNLGEDEYEGKLSVFAQFVNANVHLLDLVLILIDFSLNNINVFYSQWAGKNSPQILKASLIFSLKKKVL